MDKLIVLTLCRRYGYTRRVLEALAACDGIGEYHVGLFVDPGNPAVEDFAESFPLPHKTVVRHAARIGCNTNTRAALAWGFARSEYVVALEDDIVPARDCLRLFEACRHLGSDPTVFSVTAYNTDAAGPGESHLLRRRQWFHPWGWATWRDRWVEMNAGWIGHDEVGSWDGVIHQRVRGDRTEVYPVLARSQNIGAIDGEFCRSPAWHARHQFNACWAGGVTVPAGRFREEGDAPVSPAVSGQYGVLTLCPADYFPGLQLLAESCAGIPMRCVDAGLTPEQAAWCDAAGIERIPLADLPLPPGWEEMGPFWQKLCWAKPFAIRSASAGWERVVWLDSDSALLAPAAELFAQLDDGPLLTPDHYGYPPQTHPSGNPDVCNPPALYNRMPVADVPELRLNAGVVGFDRTRDGALLDAWCGFVTQAAADPSLREVISFLDQGSLIWAARKTGQTRVAEPRWNTPAVREPRDGRPCTGPEALAQIRAAHPGAAIVHWMGRPKFWEL